MDSKLRNSGISLYRYSENTSFRQSIITKSHNEKPLNPHIYIAKCHVFLAFNRFFIHFLGRTYKNAYLCAQFKRILFSLRIKKHNNKIK